MNIAPGWWGQKIDRDGLSRGKDVSRGFSKVYLPCLVVFEIGWHVILEPACNWRGRKKRKAKLDRSTASSAGDVSRLQAAFPATAKRNPWKEILDHAEPIW